jgi:hypothetical protein
MAAQVQVVLLLSPPTMEGLRRHRSGGSSGSSSNRRIAALRRHVVQPHEAAAGATVQDGAVLLALEENGARVRIPASFGQATAQRSSGDTVEMGGFVVQVTNPRGAVGLHVPGEEDASQALLAATTANGEFVDVQLDTEKHPALIARFALEVARHIVGPLYKDYWATADPEVWGEPGPGKIGKAAEFFGLLPQAASGAATVVGSGPGAVLMAFFARSAGLKGAQTPICGQFLIGKCTMILNLPRQARDHQETLERKNAYLQAPSP